MVMVKVKVKVKVVKCFVVSLNDVATTLQQFIITVIISVFC